MLKVLSKKSFRKEATRLYSGHGKTQMPSSLRTCKAVYFAEKNHNSQAVSQLRNRVKY